MSGLMLVAHVWFLLVCSENSTKGLQAELPPSSPPPLPLLPPSVIRLSIPKRHRVCLQCGSSDGSSVVWTLRDRKVLVTRQGGHTTNEDRQHYLLLPDGGLCVLQLHESDSGGYRCNRQLVAELQVLTGHDFMVSSGWTLQLPCSGSSKPKQRWFHQREGGRREAVLTRFRNGIVRPEHDDIRLSVANDALQIQNLQLEDAGEYLCNGVLQARVSVRTVLPEPTSSFQPSTSTEQDSVTTTDAVEAKKKKKGRKRPENALLLVALVGLGLMTVLLVSVCVLLTSIKCRRRRHTAAQRHEDTELQLWKTPSGQTEYEEVENLSPQDETIHYASLGRQNWRDRPSRTPPDQNQAVIYSSVITR
ncbi:uncharacterized protein LOC114445251 [Parambassis ranga]|uniref:Uncharacterized protein LOC114445251 n=1 Tax=Parambassis ranga TaxID=210632 RepID=A0A6P7JGV0_9TELE|nr:uncharacterized protein LOC114445251 [Parambassis ranga]